MAANNAPEPEVNTPEADRFREQALGMIHCLGRDGVDHALETLFAISDLVLNHRHCARHTLHRILDILLEAFPPSDSEEES